jgi:hypothetical protein
VRGGGAEANADRSIRLHPSTRDGRISCTRAAAAVEAPGQARARDRDSVVVFGWLLPQFIEAHWPTLSTSATAISAMVVVTASARTSAKLFALPGLFA